MAVGSVCDASVICSWPAPAAGESDLQDRTNSIKV
jgi:hypothetical protein